MFVIFRGWKGWRKEKVFASGFGQDTVKYLHDEGWSWQIAGQITNIVATWQLGKTSTIQNFLHLSKLLSFFQRALPVLSPFSTLLSLIYFYEKTFSLTRYIIFHNKNATNSNRAWINNHLSIVCKIFPFPSCLVEKALYQRSSFSCW
jgi:hypothetical protein